MSVALVTVPRAIIDPAEVASATREQVPPALTTVRVKRKGGIGAAAGQMRLARLERRASQARVDLGFEIVTREST